jgi:hypothetical protein
MKKTLTALFLLASGLVTNACPVCERATAKTAFGSITHGTGPTSNWDYVAVVIAIISVLLTLVYTIKYLVKPDEKNNDHIKYSILNFEQ